jgi:hypothetical protein
MGTAPPVVARRSISRFRSRGYSRLPPDRARALPFGPARKSSSRPSGGKQRLVVSNEEVHEVFTGGRERAVRLVFEHERDYPSQWAAIGSIAGKFGSFAGDAASLGAPSQDRSATA